MPKCKGHVHVIVDGEEKPVLCDSELEEVGFAKDRNMRYYICRNPECSEYKDIQDSEVKEIDV